MTAVHLSNFATNTFASPQSRQSYSLFQLSAESQRKFIRTYYFKVSLLCFLSQQLSKDSWATYSVASSLTKAYLQSNHRGRQTSLATALLFCASSSIEVCL